MESDIRLLRVLNYLAVAMVAYLVVLAVALALNGSLPACGQTNVDPPYAAPVLLGVAAVIGVAEAYFGTYLCKGRVHARMVVVPALLVFLFAGLVLMFWFDGGGRFAYFSPVLAVIFLHAVTANRIQKTKDRYVRVKVRIKKEAPFED